jgi:hypothetical protein
MRSKKMRSKKMRPRDELRAFACLAATSGNDDGGERGVVH